MHKKRMAISTKILLAGIIMITAVIFLFLSALSHPLASSPLSPSAMKILTGATFVTGCALVVAGIVGKVLIGLLKGKMR